MRVILFVTIVTITVPHESKKKKKNKQTQEEEKWRISFFFRSVEWCVCSFTCVEFFLILMVVVHGGVWWTIKSCRLTNVMRHYLWRRGSFEQRGAANIHIYYKHWCEHCLYIQLFSFPLPKSLPHFLFISLLPGVHPSLFLSSSLSNSIYVLKIVALSHQYCWYPTFIISFIVNSDKKDDHKRGERWTV